MSRTFVGIGFGPIQSGLFLYEAARSENFDRLIVAEVASSVVQQVRQAGGTYTINIAERNRVVAETVEGLEIYNPDDAADHAQLVAAIAESKEIATALPAVEFYNRGHPSPAELLAAGLMEKKRTSESRNTLIYAAENHLQSAEVLYAQVRSHLPADYHEWLDEHVQFVNTVIGKMSGVIDDPEEMASPQLQPLIAGGTRAILVEEFNHILIERVRLSNFKRGLTVFEEKSDLLPFEEAKLYGHNAAHALMGYLAHRQGYQFMSQVRGTDLVNLVRRAFLEESGKALCRKYDTLDPLFSEAGWEAYATDLLERMTNPHLRDTVARIIRSPARKLGWNDRLIGTMRLALGYGIQPNLHALGAAAALTMLRENQPGDLVQVLAGCWKDSDGSREERENVAALVMQAHQEI